MMYSIIFVMLTIFIMAGMISLILYYGDAVAQASRFFQSNAKWRKYNKVTIVLYSLHDIGPCVRAGLLLRTSTTSIVVSVILFWLISSHAQVDINLLIATITNVTMYLVIVVVSMLKLSPLGAKFRHFIPFGYDLWYFLRDRGMTCLD